MSLVEMEAVDSIRESQWLRSVSGRLLEESRKRLWLQVDDSSGESRQRLLLQVDGSLGL